MAGFRSPRGSAASPRGLARSASACGGIAPFSQGCGQAPLSPVRTIRSPSPTPRTVALGDAATVPVSSASVPGSACHRPNSPGDAVVRSFAATSSAMATGMASCLSSSHAAAAASGSPMVQDISLQLPVRVEGAAGEAQSRLAEAFRAAAASSTATGTPRPLAGQDGAAHGGAGALAAAALASPGRLPPSQTSVAHLAGGAVQPFAPTGVVVPSQRPPGARHLTPPLPLAALSNSATVPGGGSRPSSRASTPRGSLIMRTGPAKVFVDDRPAAAAVVTASHQARFGSDELSQGGHSFQDSFSNGTAWA